MNPEEIKAGPSFKPWCVRALAAGDKSQTRRAANLPPCEFPYKFYGPARADIAQEREDVDEGDFLWGEADYPEEGTFVHNPRYKKGQIYYVREALEVDYGYARYVADGARVFLLNGAPMVWNKRNGESYKDDKLPAMFMRKEAARYFIRIEDVWVEEYGEISEEDAMAEGIDYHPDWFEEILETADPGDASRFFNEVVLPGIHEPVPDWLLAHEFETLTREQVEGL